MNPVVKQKLFDLGWIGGNYESALEFIKRKFKLNITFNEVELRINSINTPRGLFIDGRCGIECAIETAMKLVGEI